MVPARLITQRESVTMLVEHQRRGRHSCKLDMEPLFSVVGKHPYLPPAIRTLTIGDDYLTNSHYHARHWPFRSESGLKISYVDFNTLFPFHT